jgi:hypothetical protein
VPAGVGQAPEECYGPAVGGASVSTTLDNVTATTDGAGNFDLTSTIPEKDDECRTFTITISAAAHPTLTINARGFATSNSTHRQFFSLSPPAPTFMSSGC